MKQFAVEIVHQDTQEEETKTVSSSLAIASLVENMKIGDALVINRIDDRKFGEI